MTVTSAPTSAAQGLGSTTRIAEINGIEIAWEEWGDGPPLLLVMGLGGQLIDWPPGFVSLLAEQFRVIVFDNRDMGLSSRIEGAPPSTRDLVLSQFRPSSMTAFYSLSDMANDAIGLLDHLDIDRAHVVGMSMGGMIAQTIAIEHQTRVLSLTSIMSNTGDNKHGQSALGVMLKLARQPEPTRETAVDANVEMFRMISGSTWNEAEHRARAEISIARSWSPDGTGRQLAAIRTSPDRTPGLRRVTAPTLVVHGLADPLVKPSGGIATSKAVPHSRLLMFPDMGHDLPASRWEEIVAAIADLAAVHLTN